MIEPSEGKTMSKLTVEKPVTMTPENIKAGVNIGGVDGTYVGSGGSSVQSDWAQNSTTAADYIKNRPGAYYDTIPAKTYSFDGNLTGKTYNATMSIVFVSSDVITKDTLSASTYTRVVNGEPTTAAVTDAIDFNGVFIVGDMSTQDTYVIVIPTDEASASFGVAKGIWFYCNADATVYTSALTTPGSSIPVELPQELTEVKQADWSATSGGSSIQNRIGGYYNQGINPPDIMITFDGSFAGKTTFPMGDKQALVKVLDYPLTMMQLASAKNITVYMNGADVSVGNSIELPRWESNNALDAGKWVICKIFNVQSGATADAGGIVSAFASFSFPAGTYLLVNTNSDGSIKQPYIKSIDFEVPDCDMLYGWYIYPDFNGKPISGDTLILPSSTHSSTKKFKISVDDTGTIKATEVTN